MTDVGALHPHAADTHDCEFFSPSCDPTSFWLYLSTSVVLITAAGLMAGLTMGLLSLDMLNMRILEMEGTPSEKRSAKRVIPVLSKHHFVLVTLLLVNAGANEALPIFLSKLVPESISIVLSVTCVLLFGEILPSAVFTGPNQLRIAAALTPFVRMLMAVTSPVSYPISRVLDAILGADHDAVRYKRQELKALVALQKETDAMRRTFIEQHHREDVEDGHTHAAHRHRSQSDSSTATPGSGLHHRPQGRNSFAETMLRENSAQSTRLHLDEITIIHGALDLSAKTVREVMIPIEKVFMLEYNTKLDENVMADILASGYSRIPVYRDYKANIVGLLLVKRLIVVDPEDERTVGDLVLRKPIVTSPDEACYHILNEFQKGRSHIALVTKEAKLVMECWHDDMDIPPTVEFVGIITIEDVIEEIIQEEIEDESDVYVHDVVNYWRKRGLRNKVHKEKGGFIKKRLKILADRARNRVRTRHLAMGKKLGASPAAALLQVGGPGPIEIKVVSEKTPLLSS